MFDRFSWKIFHRLLGLQLTSVVVRVLLFIYVQQTAWVVWGPACCCSSTCHLPGGTFSPSTSHPAGGILCGTTFVGFTIYADNILLLAPTRGALQLMVKAAEIFASSHNIVFSTDPSPAFGKSKCLWFCGNSGVVS